MNIKTEACMDFDDNMAWGDDLDDGNEDEKDKTKDRPKISLIILLEINLKLVKHFDPMKSASLEISPKRNVEISSTFSSMS